MADNMYSLAGVTINSVESPTASAGAGALGLAGFIAPLAQFNQALNTVSLDIRLLTAGQNKLGEALASLTAVMLSARPLFKGRGGDRTADGKAGIAAGMPGDHTLPPVAVLLATGASSDLAGTLSEHPDITLNKGDNATADQLTARKVLGPGPLKIAQDLRTDVPTANISMFEQLTRQPVAQQTSLLKVLIESDERISPLAQKPKGFKNTSSLPSEKTANASSKSEGSTARSEDGEVHSKKASDTLDASCSRLCCAPISDKCGALTSRSAQVDGLGSADEKNPSVAKGLGGITATLSSIVSKVWEAVIDELLSNVAKQILKHTASYLPKKLGDLITDGDQLKKTPAKESGPEKNPEQSQDDKGDKDRKKGGKKGQKPPREKLQPKDSAQLEIKVRPRVNAPAPAPATAQVRSLVPLAGPSQAAPLSGGMAKAGTFFAKKVPGLNVLSAGVDIAQGVISGDSKAVASSAGMLVGSYAGAALGTMIFPGVGTAIGGYLGGIAGSILGEKLATPSDRLGAPQQVSKDLTNAQSQNQQINYSPSIQVTCTAADNSEQIRMVVAQQLQAQFHGEFVPLMGTNALATRRDAALTDGGI
jgi:outer membrane lipoprotein SlyB